MDPRGNKGTKYKLSEIDLFVQTGSILCQDRRRHDSILESARFGHLNIASEKVPFLSIFHVIPIEMVWIQFKGALRFQKMTIFGDHFNCPCCRAASGLGHRISGVMFQKVCIGGCDSLHSDQVENLPQRPAANRSNRIKIFCP